MFDTCFHLAARGMIHKFWSDHMTATNVLRICIILTSKVFEWCSVYSAVRLMMGRDQDFQSEVVIEAAFYIHK